MNGEIGQMVFGDVPKCKSLRSDLFGPHFQSKSEWVHYLSNVQPSVDRVLAAPASQWSRKTFQQLYVACWIHNPVAKGTYMLSLEHLTSQSKGEVKKAMNALHSRGSSHLGGGGRSAAVGGWFLRSQFNFLKGGQELLVQYEEGAAGGDHLMLKCEGHTTKWGGPPHLLSLFYKQLTGAGKPFNPVLEDLAKQSANVDGRSAENFSSGWEKMLNKTKMHGQYSEFGKYMTVRKALEGLHDYSSALHGVPLPNTSIDYQHATNDQLADVAKAFADHLRTGRLQVLYKTKFHRREFWSLGYRRKELGPKDQSKLAGDLMEISKSLRNTEGVADRYFLEVYVRPSELDRSISTFLSYAE